VIRSLIWLPIALGLLVLYPAAALPEPGQAADAFRAAREATFATGIRDFLPAGLSGLMLTGMLAALASTIDTHLNWGASYWANDIYRRFAAPLLLKREAGRRELVWVARLSNLGLILIAVLIMARLSSIQGAWHVSLLFGSGLGVVLMLRWLWYRINLWSEYAAAGSSLVIAPVLLLGFPDLAEGARLLTLVGLSTTVVVAVTLAAPPEDSGRLLDFYRRVRPPGGWGPVAERAGENAAEPLRQFGRKMLATVLFSAGVFGILLGAGRWMLSS